MVNVVWQHLRFILSVYRCETSGLPGDVLRVDGATVRRPKTLSHQGVCPDPLPLGLHHPHLPLLRRLARLPADYVVHQVGQCKHRCRRSARLSSEMNKGA